MKLSHLFTFMQGEKQSSHEEKPNTSSSAFSWLKHQARNVCTMKFLHRKLPICRWFPTYKLKYLPHDILAGCTVGLTAIPQGIAYGIIAELGPQYGLYSCLMSSVLYIFFGSCKDITIGPTAILSLLTRPYVMAYNSDFAVLLCFLSGFVVFGLGVLHLGFLVDFISIPVTIGFTSAAAITVGSAQLKSLLGIPGRADGFLKTWISIFKNISDIKLWDSILGFSTIIMLLLMRKVKDYSAGRNNPHLNLKIRMFRTFLWFLSIARNALVIVFGIILAYFLSDDSGSPFRLTGKISEGLPPFQPPPFSTSENGTDYTFSSMANIYGTTIGVTPLIAILAHFAIAKALSKGKPVDATQELIALGLCNIGGSFVRSMPVTGSFTRSCVNNASGVRTTLGGLFTSILILLTLGFLTSTFALIPRTSLAGLIICAMIFMVEYEIIPVLWKTEKIDLIPLAVTFFLCLLWSLEYGMIVGVALSVTFILSKAARPNIHIQHIHVASENVLLVTPDSGLFFPAAENLREIIIKTSSQSAEDISVIVIDGNRVHSIDATIIKNLKLLIDDLKVLKQKIIFWNWKPSIRRKCHNLDEAFGKSFSDVDTIDEIFRDSMKYDEVPPVNVSKVNLTKNEQGVVNAAFVLYDMDVDDREAVTPVASENQIYNSRQDQAIANVKDKAEKCERTNHENIV